MQMKKLALLSGLIVFVFFNLKIRDGVYLSTIIFIPLVVAYDLIYPRKNRSQILLYCLILWFLILTLIQYVAGVYALGVLALEPVKIILICYGVIILIRNSSTTATELFDLLPWVVSSYIVYVYFFVDWNSYDLVRDRFQAPSFGSSNSLAYVVAFCLLSIHINYQSRSLSTKLLSLLCFSVLLLALVGAQSRGGLLTYVVGLFFLLKNRMRIPVICLLALIIPIFLSLSGMVVDARYDLVNDLSETGGSGRLIIWGSLISELIANPTSLILGRGPVSIELFGVTVESAHSMIIQLLYNFGFLGVVVYLAILWSFVRLCFSAESKMTRQGFAIFAMIIFSSFFDSVLFSIQLVWFNAILIALVVISSKKNFPSYITR